MQQFKIKSIDYNVLGDELEVELCQYENQIKFEQPWLNREWDTLIFESEFKALEKLRELYPERLLTIFEETGKVLTHVNNNQESWLTTIIIKKLNNPQED